MLKRNTKPFTKINTTKFRELGVPFTKIQFRKICTQIRYSEVKSVSILQINALNEDKIYNLILGGMDIGAYPKPKNQVKILQKPKKILKNWLNLPVGDNRKTDSINDNNRKTPQIMLKKTKKQAQCNNGAPELLKWKTKKTQK